MDMTKMPSDGEVSTISTVRDLNQIDYGEIPFVDLTRQYSKYKYEIKLAINRVLTSGVYSCGPETEGFEAEFADYYGVPYSIAVSSGTRALEIGLAALGVQPGDGVVCVANAGMHSTAAIRAVGGVPQYAEIDPYTLTMSPESLENSITPITKAVVVTHLYGRVADLKSIAAITNRCNLPLVEDCFQANGAHLNGSKVGTGGQVGCFSFSPEKNLGGLGEAGAIITQDAATAEKARLIRQFGDNSDQNPDQSLNKSMFMDEIQAAVLRVKLPMLEEWNLRRRMIAQAYKMKFDALAIDLNYDFQINGSVFQHFVIRCVHRDMLQKKLSMKGVGSVVHYPKPDYFYSPKGQVGGNLELLLETEKACSEVLSLPCYPELRSWEVEIICLLVEECLADINK